jgi:uncharacterized protein YndB with AHSA1/START domain
MNSPNSVEREMVIDAEPATVFAFFTDPERLLRWVGTSANLDPRPGGLVLINVHPGATARGEFKEVVPVSHLAFTWGWDEQPNVRPGSSLIEIDLAPRNGGTHMKFRHSGLPAEAVPGHTDGWKHYLGRLALAAAGKDPGPDARVTNPPGATN